MIKVTVNSKRGIEIITLFGVKDVTLAIANMFARIDKNVQILSVER
jgi:molybdenum cofactor biosynthesis enzyme